MFAGLMLAAIGTFNVFSAKTDACQMQPSCMFYVTYDRCHMALQSDCSYCDGTNEFSTGYCCHVQSGECVESGQETGLFRYCNNRCQDSPIGGV